MEESQQTSVMALEVTHDQPKDIKTKESKSEFSDWNVSDLLEYLSWSCPLNDGNVLCAIAREIISFAGNNLVLSCFNPKNIEPEYFNFNVGCVGNNGVFYIHHTYNHFYYLNDDKRTKIDFG